MSETGWLVKDRGERGPHPPEGDRRIVEATARCMAGDGAVVGFTYSGLAQAALPHRRPPNDATWRVEHGHMTVLVEPGMRPTPGGEPVSIGVPYGSRARLIIIYLQSEAVRTDSCEIELGKSLRSWLTRLGISHGGKSTRDVRDQIERILRCRFSFHVHVDGHYGIVHQNIVDAALFGRPGHTRDGSILVERIKLCDSFFRKLQKSPVSLDEAAIRAINNNSLAIDIYCWLAYCLHLLSESRQISWPALHAQFGAAYGRLDHFRVRFQGSLALALSVYRDAKVNIDQHGLVLHPSRSPIGPAAALGLAPYTKSL